MTPRLIPYFSTQVAADLWKFRQENIAKYMSGDFDQEISTIGATMELPITGDLDSLKELDDAATDYESAKTVWRALGNLTPALARENRIWTRLCHGEGLGYARKRWLEGKQPDKLVDQIGLHCFAKTLTACRDDNALSRLWWSAFIANKFAPDFPEDALSLLLKKADIRSNFVERTWMTTRGCISKALLRAMRDDPWVTEREENFRESMKALNMIGAGLALEVLDTQQVDSFVKRAVDRAKAALA